MNLSKLSDARDDTNGAESTDSQLPRGVDILIEVSGSAVDISRAGFVGEVLILV